MHVIIKAGSFKNIQNNLFQFGWNHLLVSDQTKSFSIPPTPNIQNVEGPFHPSTYERETSDLR